MQYTLRGIPPHVDDLLRRLAKAEGRSLNDVAVEALSRALGATDEPMVHRSLADIAGSWHDDPAFDEAIGAMDQIDEDLWR